MGKREDHYQKEASRAKKTLENYSYRWPINPNVFYFLLIVVLVIILLLSWL